MAPWPVERRNSSAQMAPIAKKTTPKVPINSANSFWVRLYTQSPLRTRETFSENGFGLRDSTEFAGIGQNWEVLCVRRDGVKIEERSFVAALLWITAKGESVVSVRFVAALRAERLVDGASWSKAVAEPPHSKSSGRSEFWRAPQFALGLHGLRSAAERAFSGRLRLGR